MDFPDLNSVEPQNTPENNAAPVTVDEGLQDQNGAKSSKRVWAYRFGWLAFSQIIILTLAALFFTILGKDCPTNLTNILETSSLYSLSACLLCLGLTLPEWFAPKR